MHEKESAKDLVDKVLDVIVAELLPGVDDPMQVGLHEFSDDVDVVVAGACLWAKDVEESDDVVVLKEFFIVQLLLSSFISRTMRLASMRSSNALMTCLLDSLPF